MRSPAIAFAILLATVAIAPRPAAAEGATVAIASPLVLQPGSEGKDCGLSGLNQGTNYGATEWFTAIGLPGYGMALIQFDVSAIPPGSTVTSAEITLWGAYYDGTLTLGPLAGAWDEMTATWANQPPMVVPAMDVTYPVARGAPTGPCYWGCTMPFDITNIAQHWVDNPSLNFGLRVLGNTPSVGWLMATSDNLSYPRPLLTVEFDEATPAQRTSWGMLKSRYR